jgi:hypothetical protein
MKPYYYVMRCVIHGDAELVAIGMSGERNVHMTQMNTGVIGFRLYNKKFRLEPWVQQRGFIHDDDTYKIEVQ